ncbi:MAG: hypothetical protein WC649_01935 [Desulfobacteria bacterium]
MGLAKVTTKLISLMDPEQAFDSIFLVDSVNKTLKRLPAIPLK